MSRRPDRRSRGHSRAEGRPPTPAAPLGRTAALLFLALLYLGVAALYLFLLPIDNAPDESGHRVYIQWLAENRRLPVFDPADAQHYELHQPPLYYTLCLPVYFLARHTGDTALVTRSLRFVNLLIGLAVVLLTYSFVSRLLPDRPWTALGAAGFVAFLPTHIALCTSLNNDILAEAICTAVLWLLVVQLRAGRPAAPPSEQTASRKSGRGKKARSKTRHTATEPAPSSQGFTLPRMLLAGLLTGLGLLTKSQTVFLFPVMWLAALLGWRSRDLSSRSALALALAATAAGLALGGWWLVRNQLLYGDPLGVAIFLDAFADTRPTPATMMAGLRLTPAEYLTDWVLWWTFRSFWGMFGPNAAGRFAFYPAWAYALLAAAGVASLIGLLAWLFPSSRPLPWQRRALLPPALLALLVIGSFVRFNLTFFQAQGRYLFPALQFWAVLFLVGIEQLFPRRTRRWVSLAVVLAVCLLSLLGILVIRSLPNL